MQFYLQIQLKIPFNCQRTTQVVSPCACTGVQAIERAVKDVAPQDLGIKEPMLYSGFFRRLEAVPAVLSKI